MIETNFLNVPKGSPVFVQRRKIIWARYGIFGTSTTKIKWCCVKNCEYHSMLGNRANIPLAAHDCDPRNANQCMPVGDSPLKWYFFVERGWKKNVSVEPSSYLIKMPNPL